MTLCKSNEETHVSLRYGGLVETGPSVKFSGFRVERSDKILFPVVVLLNGREFFADRVEITADAMTMIGVRVPIGSDRPSFKEMTLTLCSKESF